MINHLDVIEYWQLFESKLLTTKVSFLNFIRILNFTQLISNSINIFTKFRTVDDDPLLEHRFDYLKFTNQNFKLNYFPKYF